MYGASEFQYVVKFCSILTNKSYHGIKFNFIWDYISNAENIIKKMWKIYFLWLNFLFLLIYWVKMIEFWWLFIFPYLFIKMPQSEVIPTSRRGTPWLYYSGQDILPSVVQPGYPHPTSRNALTSTIFLLLFSTSLVHYNTIDSDVTLAYLPHHGHSHEHHGGNDQVTIHK